MENWNDRIDQTTQAFIELSSSLTEEELNWKPNTDVWSIGQNMDHILTINSSYFPILEQLHDGTYKQPIMSKFRFIVSFFGKMILKSVQPDRKKKIKTFPLWEPTKESVSLGVIDRLSQHQEVLKKEIEKSKELIEEGITIASPINRNIVYSLESAFEIIVTHEERHLAQSQETYHLLKKNDGLVS